MAWRCGHEDETEERATHERDDPLRDAQRREMRDRRRAITGEILERRGVGMEHAHRVAIAVRAARSRICAAPYCSALKMQRAMRIRAALLLELDLPEA